MFKVFAGLILNFSLLCGTFFAFNTAPVVATPPVDVLAQKIPAQLIKEVTDFVAEAHKKGLNDEEILVMCQQLLKTVGIEVLGYPLNIEIKKHHTWLNSKVIAVCFTVILVVGCLTLLGFLMHEDRLEKDIARAQALDAAVKMHELHAQDLVRLGVVRALPPEEPAADGGIDFPESGSEVAGNQGIDAETQVGKTHPMITRSMDGTRKAKIVTDW